MDAAVVGSARMLYNQIHLYDPLTNKINDNKALSDKHLKFCSLCNSLVKEILDCYRVTEDTITKALTLYDEIKDQLKDSSLIVPFTTWNITWVLNTLKTAHFMDDESYRYKYNIPYDLETRSEDVDFKIEHSTFGSLDCQVF